MRPLRDLLNTPGATTLPGTYPDTSATDPTTNEDEAAANVCTRCGMFSICGGLGYVRHDLPVDHPEFGKLARCPQIPQEVDQSRLEVLRQMSNLDAFPSKRFETFVIDRPLLTPQQRISLRTALDLAREFAEQPSGWLLLEGSYGCGKTHLAAAIGNVRLERGDGVLFITSPDLLDHLRQTYSRSSDGDYDETFDRVRTVSVLILDDLGVENPSGWAQEKLFQLLNYRYNYRLPTVVTTNAPMEKLDPRVRSRLLDQNMIRRAHIVAPDHRADAVEQRDPFSDLHLYRDMTFDTFDVRRAMTPAHRRVLEQAYQYASAYANMPDGWLILLGEYSSGKTHLAAAIANTAQERGSDVMFITVPDLMDFLRLTFDPNSSVSFDYRFQAVRNVPLLVMDDWGTESATPWVKEKLFQLFNHRWLARLPTIITTAKRLEEFDPRMSSRLRDERRCTVFMLTNQTEATPSSNSIDSQRRKRYLP